MIDPEKLRRIQEMESPVFFIHQESIPKGVFNLDIRTHNWLRKGEVIVIDKKDIEIYEQPKLL